MSEQENATTRTVLVVDDDANDRAAVRRLLRDRGRAYRIVEAATGAEGVVRLRESPIDCVLLDFHLPDMSGHEFLAALRTDRGGMLVPVAVLTGEEDDRVAADTLKLGAEDYLVKDSLTTRGLTRAIENAIEKHGIRRALEEQRAAVEMRNQRLETMRDELQHTVQELGDATRARDRFLAVMSHEMRTPLNAILGYVDLLDMEIGGELNEVQRQQLDRIRVGGRHLLDLTNDVLDLARADARRLDLDLRAVDLSAVVEEVCALLERQASERGVALIAESCGPEGPLVQADLQRLRQVLTNLVGNALKFTDQGRVTVRCVRSGEGPSARVGVEVIDTGIGIDEDSLPFVFNEFYQVKNDLTRRHGGSGLGLAISRRLSQLMGGDITITSRVGEGSTFTVWLRPAEAGSAVRPEDAAQHGARMAAHQVGGQPRNVRGVSVIAFGEDANALAELERRVRPGVRLRWTVDPELVPALAAEEHAALVVLDAGSAGGSAWRAALLMQDIPELTSTAVLLLPSLSAAIPDEASEVLDLGWVSLVPKPFTAAQLTHAVSTAAGRHEEEEPEVDAASHGDVLVVDDDADSRRVAASFLRAANVTVREVADGEAALAEMRRRRPSVVVLDLMMPVLDGFGVLAAMRADPLLAHVPAVVLTAKSLTDAERQFLSRTAGRVLQKGAHRLGDVAALVLRAAGRVQGPGREEG